MVAEKTAKNFRGLLYFATPRTLVAKTVIVFFKQSQFAINRLNCDFNNNWDKQKKQSSIRHRLSD